MSGGEGAILKVVQGRSPVSAWTFGSATSDVRIRVGSGAEATWRFLSRQVASSHFELFWDGANLWIASPFGAEVRVDGRPVSEWEQLHGRFRLQFGDVLVEGLAPRAAATDASEATSAWRTSEVLPPPDRAGSPSGFQAARGEAAPGLDEPEELPGEPTVYLHGGAPPSPPPPAAAEEDAWDEEPTRAEPLPDLDEERPTAAPAPPPAAPPPAPGGGAIQGEATVFAPIPEAPEPASARGPALGGPPPSSVQVQPDLAAIPPAPGQPPQPKEPPPPTFVLPPEPTRRGFLAQLFARRPRTEGERTAAAPAPSGSSFLQDGPKLFGQRPKVWLPALAVLALVSAGVLVAAARGKRASRPRPQAANEAVQGTGKTAEEPAGARAPAQGEPAAAPRPAKGADAEPGGGVVLAAGTSTQAPLAAGTSPYSPAQAVEWLASGRLRKALAAYEALAAAHPGEPAFATAAEILRKEVATLCAAGTRNVAACEPPPPPPPAEEAP